jgi:hypothetical protein
MGKSSDNLHSDFTPDSAPEWYCRVSGKEWGPLSTDGLQNIVRRGRLSPQDQVKNGENGDWVLAESIEGLFAEDEASQTTSEIAEKLLADDYQHPLWRSSGRTAAYRSRPVRAILRVFDFVITMLSVILNVGLSIVQPVFSSRIVLVIVGAVLLTLPQQVQPDGVSIPGITGRL